jgi:CheY-like chemotaxis protein
MRRQSAKRMQPWRRRARRRVSAAMGPRRRRMETNAAGPTVLVINDTPEILDLFQDLLGEEGFNVVPDRFTLEVGLLLKRVEELRPDLIVLDYIIGREDLGWQFLQLLKLERATRDVPVIICTGAVRQVQEMEAQLDKMGVAVVLKPFDIDHLIGVINKVLAAAAEQADPA